MIKKIRLILSIIFWSIFGLDILTGIISSMLETFGVIPEARRFFFGTTAGALVFYGYAIINFILYTRLNLHEQTFNNRWYPPLKTKPVIAFISITTIIFIALGQVWPIPTKLEYDGPIFCYLMFLCGVDFIYKALTSALRLKLFIEYEGEDISDITEFVIQHPETFKYLRSGNWRSEFFEAHPEYIEKVDPKKLESPQYDKLMGRR